MLERELISVAAAKAVFEAEESSIGRTLPPLSRQLELGRGRWNDVLDSFDARWNGGEQLRFFLD